MRSIRGTAGPRTLHTTALAKAGVLGAESRPNPALPLSVAGSDNRTVSRVARRACHCRTDPGRDLRRCVVGIGRSHYRRHITGGVRAFR